MQATRHAVPVTHLYLEDNRETTGISILLIISIYECRLVTLIRSITQVAIRTLPDYGSSSSPGAYTPHEPGTQCPPVT